MCHLDWIWNAQHIHSCLLQFAAWRRENYGWSFNGLLHKVEFGTVQFSNDGCSTHLSWGNATKQATNVFADIPWWHFPLQIMVTPFILLVQSLHGSNSFTHKVLCKCKLSFDFCNKQIVNVSDQENRPKKLMKHWMKGGWVCCIPNPNWGQLLTNLWIFTSGWFTNWCRYSEI